MVCSIGQREETVRVHKAEELDVVGTVSRYAAIANLEDVGDYVEPSAARVINSKLSFCLIIRGWFIFF